MSDRVSNGKDSWGFRHKVLRGQDIMARPLVTANDRRPVLSVGSSRNFSISWPPLTGRYGCSLLPFGDNDEAAGTP